MRSRGASGGWGSGAALACALVFAFQGSASAAEPGGAPPGSRQDPQRQSASQSSTASPAPLREARAYHNPILPGSYPDPSIVRVGADYYLVTSSFEYFPGIPIFHSRDLVHWRQLGHVLTRRSQLPLGRAPSSGGIFAATIRYHDGTFYVITTNVGPGTNFYVTAQDPAGPWSEPVIVNQQGMDPSLLFDDASHGAEPGGSRELRVFYTSQLGPGRTSHIVQAEIDPAAGELTGELLPIWHGTGEPWTEGPHLYAIDGRYYLLAAEGGTRAKHSAIIARAARPNGPFSAYPGNPIATHRGQPGSIQNVGHADLVQTLAGDWFAVLLGVRRSGDPAVHVLGRETFLAPVRWRDGWPSIGQQGRVAEVMTAVLPPPHPWPVPDLRDDFDSRQLGLEWNFLRNPPEGAWSLEARPGWLRLRGNPASLDEVGAPSFVGRRQQHAVFRAGARLAFDPHRRKDEAGLALRMNEEHHCEIALMRQAGERFAIVRLRNGDKRRVLARQRVDSAGPVTLRVASDGSRYAFAFSAKAGPEQSLGDIPIGLLSSEVSGSLTGVYIALYATGNGAPSAVPADFDWFEYSPQ